MEEEPSESYMFSGEYRHSMDEKNRVTVPAAWRNQTEGEVFFTLAHQSKDFVVVMPPAEFERMGEVVNANPTISAHDKRIFVRQFYSRARQCVTDRQGRILVPEDQRESINLGAEVILVGGHTRFEIWDPEKWSSVTGVESPTFEQVSNMVGL